MAFIHLRVTANAVTVLMIFVGIIANLLLSFQAYFVGIVFCYLSFLLDKCDGELARFYGGVSRLGIYLDEIYHFLINSSIFLAIGYSDSQHNVLSCYEGALVAYLYTLARCEYKIIYTLAVKTGLGNEKEEYPQHSKWLTQLSYALKMPLHEDITLYMIFLAYLAGRFDLFLHFYAAIIVCILFIEVMTSIKGGLGRRLDSLASRTRRHDNA